MNFSARRNRKGQGLIEGVAISVATASLFSLLVAFAVNVYVSCTASAKLQVVANEASKVFRDNDIWNGAQRPEFQRTDTEQITHKEGTANECANAIAKEMGLITNLTPQIYLSKFEFKVVNHDDGRTSEFARCTFTMPLFNLPYKFAGLFPGVLSLNAVGIATQTTEPPPAFIRLGYNLTEGDQIDSNHSTDVTQVCILPSYGFLTDPPEPGSIAANLGLNQANADVAGSHPDDRFCGWNGLNVAEKQAPDEVRPRIVGNAPRQKNANGGYTPYFGGPLPPE